MVVTMKLMVFLILLVFAVGCTPAIPGAYLSRVDRSAGYNVVRENATRYRGAVVAWGGYIYETRNTRDGTYVEIIETPLNYRNRPEAMDETRGRFLLLHPGFAEPARYAPGKAITVVGEFRGMERRRLGEIDYSYPI
ncbi:MAG: Slp family lipoprotein, partial [bacterium]|nr:Slp family lipoprotein [bacterium]